VAGKFLVIDTLLGYPRAIKVKSDNSVVRVEAKGDPLHTLTFRIPISRGNTHDCSVLKIEAEGVVAPKNDRRWLMLHVDDMRLE
jgi:hypothetical protein